MCDYSAQSAKRRDARVGDKLVTQYISDHTVGLVSPEDPSTAVCLIEGTKLKVSGLREGRLQQLLGISSTNGLATFAKRDLDPCITSGYRDGLIFNDSTTGAVLLFKDLGEGANVSVEAIPGIEQPTPQMQTTHAPPAETSRQRELVDA